MDWFWALRVRLGLDPAVNKGIEGEDAVAGKLAEKGWFRVKGLCLRNLYLPAGQEGTAEIDMVYLTRRGIYVIESKNYSGWIFGREEEAEWVLSVYAGRDWLGRIKTEKHPFYNPLWQNRGHIRALEALTGPDVPLWSVVVFPGRCHLADVEWDSEDTQVCLLEQLPRALRRMGRRTLSRGQVRRLYEQLQPYTRASWGEKKAHIRQVRRLEKARARDSGPGRCPWCGGALVLRTARRGSQAGRQFYGCIHYPDCTYTQDL